MYFLFDSGALKKWADVTPLLLQGWQMFSRCFESCRGRNRKSWHTSPGISIFMACLDNSELFCWNVFQMSAPLQSVLATILLPSCEKFTLFNPSMAWNLRLCSLSSLPGWLGDNSYKQTLTPLRPLPPTATRAWSGESVIAMQVGIQWSFSWKMWVPMGERLRFRRLY